MKPASIAIRSFGLAASSALVISLGSSGASAQTAPASEGLVAGAWTFRPTIDVRVRGEVRKSPVDTGGVVFDSSSVFAESPTSTQPPVVDQRDAVGTQYLVAERSRLGLGVDHDGTLTVQFTLQDARVFGTTEAAYTGAGQPALPSLAPLDAYFDLHTRSKKVFLRVGRQRVTWGDGRLVSENDWSPTARALDAARVGAQAGDFDLEAMGVMLAAPGALPPAATGSREPTKEGPGAQLYGLNAVWHLFPLFNLEATGLARFVREPRPRTLTPSDTYVIDARAFGDRRGFRYALEGAYELGRVSSFGVNRDLSAFAFAARVGLETSLPAHLTFGADFAYASGDSGDPTAKQKRFDPILPDEHPTYGPMGLFAWSNVLTVGGGIAAHPVEELEISAAYHLANLADAKGRWTTAALAPVGASATNTSTSLGNEVDVKAGLHVWKPVAIEAGYGLFAFGDGGKAILNDELRPANVQHWAYLQTTVRVP